MGDDLGETYGLTDIQANYVKWVTTAGGRAVYLNYSSSGDELESILSNVNGVLFTGGMLDLSQCKNPDGGSSLYHKYTLTAKKILKWAMKANDRGNYFPIWGTCQGH